MFDCIILKIRALAVVVLFACCFLGSNTELLAQDSPPSRKLYNNPIINDRGVTDPHIKIFNDKAYLFASHDEGLGNDFYVMNNWWIWSSSDLVNWSLDYTLYPANMRVGPTASSWATDAAERNGKYYFYLSANHRTTVAVSTDGPSGPYKEAIKENLLDSYDPTVFIDDDEAKTPYIMFSKYPYKIAKLNEDMISLAEEPRVITHEGKKWRGDGGFIHKYKGLYYLNGHGADYATAENIYGPYTHRGKFYSEWIDHSTVFTWKNQHYVAHGTSKGHHVRPRDKFYRETFMTYLHFKENGEKVADEVVGHSVWGVGQYDSDKTIQAEWYSAASDPDCKQEGGSGFVIGNKQNNSYLYYPKVRNVASDATINVQVSSKSSGAVIEVREDKIDGNLLGTIKVPNTKSLSDYQTISAKLSGSSGDKNIYLVFKGIKDLVNLDWFKISSTGPIPPLSRGKATATPTAVPHELIKTTSAYDKIEAESTFIYNNLRTQDSKDTDKGQNLEKIKDLSYSMYKVDFGEEIQDSLLFQARVASGYTNGGQIEIRLDEANGPLIGSCEVPSTGGWQNWSTQECKVKNVTGVHYVYLVYRGEGQVKAKKGNGMRKVELLNINWFKFSK